MLSKKILIVLAVIFLISIPKFILLIVDDNACLWEKHKDCDWYRKAVAETSPEYGMYWFLIRILRIPSLVIGFDLTVKIFLYVSNFIFLFGVYLLLKDELNFRLMIFTLISMGFILGIYRIWIELLRNMFVLMLLPFFLYFIKERKAAYTGIILGIMLISHHTGIFFIILTALFYLFLKDEKKWKELLIIYLIVFSIYVSYYATIYPIEKKFDSSVRSIVEISTNIADENRLAYNLGSLIYFNSIYLITGIIGLKLIRRKNRLTLFMGLFFFLCLFSFWFEVGYRLGMMLSFPAVILTSFFLRELISEEYRKGFYAGFLPVLIVYFLLSLRIFDPILII